MRRLKKLALDLQLRSKNKVCYYKVKGAVNVSRNYYISASKTPIWIQWHACATKFEVHFICHSN
jgi:hypothetical protein